MILIIITTKIFPESRKRGRTLRTRGRKTERQQGGGSCKKEKYRDYYIEPNGCRSESISIRLKYFL